MVFYNAGGLRAARWINRKGVRILMYHRFANAVDLEWQCRHIREFYRPVTLAQVDLWLKSGEPPPANSIAVTIDDGYRDFGEVAYPVFVAWHIPVTVYLVSDFLDGRLWLWVDQVRYAFQHSPLSRLRIELADGAALEFRLESVGQRTAAAREMCEALKRQANETRVAALAGLSESLRVAIPAEPPAEYAPLGWDDVRRMAAEAPLGAVTFGAHTRTHPVLSRIAGSDELNGEIAGSKQRIEEAVGLPVEHFCYPNGGPDDITAECVEAVRRAGFRTAVTTRTGLNYAPGDRFQLRRIGVEPGLDKLYFQRCAAAFRV